MGPSTSWLAALAVGLITSCALHWLKDGTRVIRRSDEVDAYFKELAKSINESPTVRWKARVNPWGLRQSEMGMTESLDRNETMLEEYLDKVEELFESDEMREHLGLLREFPDSQLPASFDARLKWPWCRTLHWVPNQGACGSCYANAAVGVVSDRMCIATGGRFNSLLSVDEAMACCPVCGNCLDGGDELKVLTYWVVEGLVTGGPDGCRPDNFPKDCGVPCKLDSYYRGEAMRWCGARPECQPNFYKRPSYDEDKHFGSLAYAIVPRRTKAEQSTKEDRILPSIAAHLSNSPRPTPEQTQAIIMKELLLFGPVTMDFPVTEEFLHYDSGIFHPHPAEGIRERILYWHVARIIGWGRDTATGGHYWLAVNTYGSEWGESGLFRFDTHALLDQNFKLEVHAGMPRLRQM